MRYLAKIRFSKEVISVIPYDKFIIASDTFVSSEENSFLNLEKMEIDAILLYDCMILLYVVFWCMIFLFCDGIRYKAKIKFPYEVTWIVPYQKFIIPSDTYEHYGKFMS